MSPIFVRFGEMVEGAKCDIYTRKGVRKGMYNDPITQKPMLKYELSRNSSVEVTKALDLTPEQKDIREKLPVHSEVGDKIKGDSITLFIDQKIPVRMEVKEGTSARHGASLFSTSKRTIGVIKYTFDNLTPALKNDLSHLLPPKTE